MYKTPKQIIAAVWFLAVMLSILYTPHAAWAANIDGANKWAWSTNAGWNNFHDTNGEVSVYADHLEGYVWAENIGWIRLGAYTSGGSYTYLNTLNTNYGVNRDPGTGALSGFAWSSNAGWIKFNPTNGGVTVDPATGEFSGYAWAENIGWVKLNGTAQNAAKYKVAVDPSYIYPVTATANSGGTVSPASRNVINGNTTQFTVAPEPYCSRTDTVNGNCPPGTWNGNSYTTGIITSACSLTFNFSCDYPPPLTYVVNATAGKYGTVDPTSQRVSPGNTAQFTVSPSLNYTHDAVVGGDCPAGLWNGNTYTTGSVNANCSASFSFTRSGFPALSATPSNRSVTNDAGVTTFSVANTGTGDMKWVSQVTSGGSWLEITSGPSGTNSGTITCSFTANTGASRTGFILVTAADATGSPKEVIITQAGGGQPILSVAPANRDITKDAGATTFSVSNTGSGTMKWVAQVTSGSSWLEITSGASGTNAGTITCSFTTNTGTTLRTGTIRVTAAGTTGSPKDVTVTQSAYARIVSNAIGNFNFIKISDLSGALPTDGGNINLKTWDVNGVELPESANAPVLKLFNHGTTMVTGPDLADRFPSGTPMLYEFSINAAQLVITNVKDGANGAVRVPISYARGLKNYVSNFTGSRNFIKISDMTGALPASGATISVIAWDVDGNALPESVDAAPIKLYNHGMTVIEGSDIATRFLTGIPMTYLFNIESDKFLLTNVKRSTGNWIHVPAGQPFGLSNYVTNFTGPYNILHISDLSGVLPAEGEVIGVNAWDTNGHAIAESVGAAPLLLDNHGTTTIGGPELIARFSAGAPMTYEFVVNSAKVLIQNVKSSYTDGMIKAPVFYTKGISNFVINYVSNLNTFKISDVSGALSGSGGAISIKAWDVDGNALVESGGAAPLNLHNHATTILEGAALAARFPDGTPVTYEFSIGSSSALITVLTRSQDGTVKIPTVFTIGDCAGI